MGRFLVLLGLGGCTGWFLPTVDTLELTPSPLTAADDATAVVGASNLDHEPITIAYHWSVDGVALSEVGPTLARGAFAKGDVVRVEVVSSDADGDGDPVAVEVTVEDAPPTAPVAQILPADAVWGRDALDCAVAIASDDPDGDPVSYTATWTADGAPWFGPVRGVDTTTARQWACALVPNDGTLDGPPSATAVVDPPPSGSNVLVLVLDDIGNDRPAFTGEHPSPAPTPHLDQLAAEGVYFPNMYISPLCSPSRAMALTGRYPRRTGIGYIVDHWLWQVELAGSEITPAEALEWSALPYSASFAGKWHLSSAVSGARGPTDQGFGWFAGSLGNPRDPPGSGHDYFDWEKYVDGQSTLSSTYMTTDTVDDALERIDAMPEPWLTWVSFNAAHLPLHDPPAELHPQTPITVDSTDFDRHTAVVEALDTEIGRLLDQIPTDVRERTTVVMFGDNGTDSQGTIAPWDPRMAKETVYEAGINVPLVISGPLVRTPGARSEAFVNAVDVLPTIAAIGGVDVRDLPTVLDGVELLPFLADVDAPAVRDHVFAEHFAKMVPGSVGQRDRDDTWKANGPPPYDFQEEAVRDERWKLVRHDILGVETFEFYDLQGLDVEADDLLPGGLDPTQQAAFDRLYDLLEQDLLEQAYDVPNQPVYLADAHVDPPLAALGEDLTCAVDRVIDGDDDPVTLSWRWTADGVQVGTGSTLPAASFAHGADVRCIAAGTDESGIPTELEATATWSP